MSDGFAKKGPKLEKTLFLDFTGKLYIYIFFKPEIKFKKTIQYMHINANIYQ